MKEEKEIKLIVNLLNEKNLSSSLFKKSGSPKKEYERICNNSINDKEFHNWFDKMIKKGIINFLEYRENHKGIPTKIYSFDRNKLFKYLNEFKHYKALYDIAIEDYFSLH